MARNTYGFFPTLQRVLRNPDVYITYVIGRFKRSCRYYKSLLLNQNHIEPYYRQTLELMLSDNKLETSRLWNRLSSDFKMEIIGRGLDDFKSGFLNGNYASRRPGRPLEISAAWQYYNTVRAKDSLGILDRHPEPGIGKPCTVNLNGREISWDYIQAIDEFYNMIGTFNIQLTDELIICEIGGGYGRLAQLFLRLMPRCHYVLVDIPTSLILAYYYLSKVFPDDIQAYETTRSAPEYTREILTAKRLTFLLPHQLPRVQKRVVDLFINIDSFQELTPPIVKDYFRLIQELGKNYLYLNNSNQPANNFIDDEDFRLADYPAKIGMKVIKTQTSVPYLNMIEQFITLNHPAQGGQ